MPVALEYRSDHLLLRMVGPTALASLRRVLFVPYSNIASVEVGEPRWPSAFGPRVGTHLPKVIASGTFSDWRLKDRRFLHFDRNSGEVLTIRLLGHPSFDEISVEVRDPHAARKELEARRAPHA